MKAVIEAASQYGPWSKPESDGQDWWTFNSYMKVPPERRIVSYERDVNEICSRLFGAYSGGNRYAGCVDYGISDDGLMANVFLPRKGSPETTDHELRHADGWVHPWVGFMKQHPEYATP
jgi:hypothetical protein